jgi:serine/threonine protein kinase
MAQYIPVKTRRRRDCEALHSVYERKNRLGKGSFGEIYEACVRTTGDCGYVLKVITYDHRYFRKHGGKSMERCYREWKNEVEIFTRINELQQKYGEAFSPKIFDSWFCNEKGYVYFYILMEKYDGDLFHLLDAYDDGKRNLSILMALERMSLYLKLIHMELEICLNDVKLQNILYKITPSGVSVVFSDFGIATQYSDEECIRIDQENFDALKRQFSLVRR